MLGVRWAGVTVALHTLVKKGAIVTRRGGDLICDRTVLLGIASAGYGAAEGEYQRLVTPAFPSPVQSASASPWMLIDNLYAWYEATDLR